MNDITNPGAIADGYDIRQFHFDPTIAGAAPFDWNVGFDIEKKIGTKLVVKDQNGSSSCGGQAWAYLGEVLEAIATGSYEPRSARWIYSHTAAPGGGSNGRTNCAFVINNGWLQEKYATSYENGKPPSETFMLVQPVNVPEDTEITKGASYLQVAADIDVVAEAIAQNNGCILFVYGQDNGTWRSAFPKPPTKPKSQCWAHWLYAGKIKMVDGKKYIGVCNSWGNATGQDGWQWFGEDYFTSGKIAYGFTVAFDYKAPAHKILLIKTIALLKQMVAVLTKK